MTSPLGVGVVGAGRFAGLLAGAVADLPEVRPVAVAHPSPLSRRQPDGAPLTTEERA